MALLNKRRLIWSNRALKEYHQLLIFLTENWGQDLAFKIITEIDDKTIQILKSPEHYPIFHQEKEIRRCVFSPQTSIFFKVKNNVVEITSVFDNRQNPKKLKL